MAQTRVGHLIDNLIFGTHILEGNYKHPLVPTTPISSWLDVGGGNGIASTTMELNFKVFHGEKGQRKVCVDPKGWESGEDWRIIRELYNEYCSVWNDHFDVVSCLDTIEHLTKKEGEKWLDHFEEVADRLIIIFTPDGFLPQGPEQGEKFDELEKHRSGWEAEDFLKRGYCVYRTPKDFHHNPTGVIGDFGALLCWKNRAI